MRRQQATIQEVVNERERQDATWGTHFPDRSHDRWLSILVEEVGEAAEAILQSDGTPDKQTKTLEDVRREVVQIAAVAISWLEFGQWEQEERGEVSLIVDEALVEDIPDPDQRSAATERILESLAQTAKRWPFGKNGKLWQASDRFSFARWLLDEPEPE